jgi:hypothetical protein
MRLDEYRRPLGRTVEGAMGALRCARRVEPRNADEDWNEPSDRVSCAGRQPNNNYSDAVGFLPQTDKLKIFYI